MFSLFLQCLPMSQNNSVERVEDTMFPSSELLEFTSGCHLPCAAFTSRNHDRKLCGWCVAKSWLIVQALPPVPEKPGLIHCNFAQTEMASSLTWCCLNWENEFSPLTEARKELLPYYLPPSVSPVTRQWLHSYTDCREASMAALKHGVCLCMRSLELWPYLKSKGSCSSGFCKKPDEVKSGNSLWKPRTFCSLRVTCFANVLALILD